MIAADRSAVLRARIDGLSFPGRALVPYVVAFVLAFAAFHHGYENLKAQPMTGDEPSYLLDAFSMARDGDRDLSNQFSFEHPERLAALFGGTAAFPHYLENTSAGKISWHGAGLGFAVVPGVWMGDWRGDPVDWVRLELVLIDALAALALFAVVRRAAHLLRIRQAFAWSAWASAVLSLPLLSYADQLYPEVPALLCILLALNAAMRPRPGWLTLLAGSAAASYLPWLHIRFIPVCLGLLLALALRGLATLQQPPHPANDLREWLRGVPGELRGLAQTARTRAGLGIVAAVAAPALLSFGFMAVEFQRWYGSPQWTATGGGGGGAPAVVTDTWYPAVLGGLFGTDYGWVPWAPVAVLALAALGCLLVAAPRWTIYALLFAGVYQAELAFSGIATPGFVFPGRYEIVCIPLLAVPLMVALARIPVAWLAFIPLMLATLAITHQASERSGINLLNTGAVGLPMAAHLTSAFPDVEDPVATTAFIAEAAGLGGTVGHLTPDKAARIARPSDRSGYLIAGPRAPLAAGAYAAHFLITQTGGSGGKTLVELQSWAIPGTTLATLKLSARDLPDGKPTQVNLPFATPGGLAVETRAFVTGRATITSGGTSVTAVAITAQPGRDRYPDASLMAAWAGGTIFLAALLGYCLAVKRRLQPAP